MPGCERTARRVLGTDVPDHERHWAMHDALSLGLTRWITQGSVFVYQVTTMQEHKPAQPCPAKAALRHRPLLTQEQASAMEVLFGVLANDTRLRLLHEIARREEACTTELAEVLAMRPQAVCNQLQRLQDKGIVIGRRSGNNVHYRIVDNCVVILLERGLCLIEEAAKRSNG